MDTLNLNPDEQLPEDELHSNEADSTGPLDPEILKEEGRKQRLATQTARREAFLEKLSEIYHSGKLDTYYGHIRIPGEES